MRQVSTPRPTHLLRRQTFNLRARKGQRIECISGHVWITQDGDPRDVILAPHERFVLDRHGQVLVSALEDASFQLCTTESPAQVANPSRTTAPGTPAMNCAY